MPFISPGDIPPEILEAMRRQADEHQMLGEVQAHMISQTLDELNVDQLTALRLMFNACEGIHAAYYSGRITQMLETKWGICTGCGVKHDDPSDLIEENEPESEPRTTEQIQVEMADKVISEDFEKSIEADDRLIRVAEADLSKTWDSVVPEILEEYNLEVSRHINDTEVPPHLKCKSCGTPSVSLADRMKQPPGVKGCSACQQKAKWG